MLKINFCMILAGLLFLTATTNAQRMPGSPPARTMPEDLPMQSILYKLDRIATESQSSAQEVSAWIHSKKFVSRENGRINVEIINQSGDDPLPTEIVTRFNGKIGTIWRNRMSIWIMPDQLLRLAKALPAGFYMEKASVPIPNNEGPSVIGSDHYRWGGADGSGINVGIIDFGYTSLNIVTNGTLGPEDYTEVNYTDDGFETGGTHGTQCVETVFDHAPGADYFIYKIGNLTDLGPAVDHAVENDVDILSHSIGWFNTGWDDGTGTACEAAQTAASNGILFCTAAGNHAQKHWKGNFLDVDGNNYHEFSAYNETIRISIPNSGTVDFYLCWNTSGGTYNYDLYLFDETLSNELESSTNSGNNYESLSYTNSTGSTQTVHLVVYRSGGATTEFEIFTYGACTWQEHIISTSSILSPSNSTSSNVVSVAAVDQSDFGSLSGTSGIIMDYSSRGPTNSGNQAPDITGPTNTTTREGVFTGTSCATPNVAGAAAAFWSSAPFLDATGVRLLLLAKAKIFRDWGTTDTDYTYGYGGAQLHTYRANTIWVDRTAGNVLGYSTAPYFYVSDAQNAVTTPGRIVFLEDHFPEPIILNKGHVIYEAIGSGAVLGQ